MTREEAIARIIEHQIIHKMYEPRAIHISEALDMAIEALSQTDGDLISHNDVKNMFNTMDRYKADKLILQDTDREFPSNEVFIVNDCYELLEQLPTYSAPPQKTGHWIKYSFPRCGEQHYKCTLCGYYINFGQWSEFYTKEFKYCPHCGGKMDGKERKDEE